MARVFGAVGKVSQAESPLTFETSTTGTPPEYHDKQISIKVLVAQDHTELRAYHAQWMEFTQKKNKEIHPQLNEIARLRVRS